MPGSGFQPAAAPAFMILPQILLQLFFKALVPHTL